MKQVSLSNFRSNLVFNSCLLREVHKPMSTNPFDSTDKKYRWLGSVNLTSNLSSPTNNWVMMGNSLNLSESISVHQLTNTYSIQWPLEAKQLLDTRYKTGKKTAHASESFTNDLEKAVKYLIFPK